MHPYPERLQRDIDEAFDRAIKRPNASALERRERLQRIARAARELAAALREADADTRYAIASCALTADPIGLIAPLEQLAQQAERAFQHAPKPRRGPQRKDPLRQLAAELAIIWCTAYPEKAPGIRKVAGEPCGPMLDFVRAALEGAGVHVQSKDALGKMLYELRSRICRLAHTERRKRLVERRIGRVKVVSREAEAPTQPPQAEAPAQPPPGGH